MITHADNPLNNSSYTVHYRVFLTNSLKDAEHIKLHFEDVVDAVNRATSATINTTNYQRSVIDIKVKDKQLHFYDLINSRRDADFNIVRFEMESYISEMPANTNVNVSTSIGGRMDVHEAYSGQFLLLLNQIISGIDGTTSDGKKVSKGDNLNFVIKQYFVTDDTYKERDDKSADFFGASKKIHSNNIPMILIPVQISANYSQTGSDYQLTLVSVNNGLASLPTVSFDLMNQVKLATTSTTTVEKALKDFAIGINDMYKKRALPNSTKPGATEFYRYNFIINVDEEYKKATYLIDNAALFNSTDGKGGTTTVFFGMVIPEAILSLLDMSKQILLDATFDKDNTISHDDIVKDDKSKVQFQKRYKPYISSRMKSHEGSDADLIDVIYTVKRQLLITANDNGTGFTSDKDYSSVMEFEKLIYDKKQSNVLVYDYLYTGKNVDVYDFKLAIISGLSVPYIAEDNTLFPKLPQSTVLEIATDVNINGTADINSLYNSIGSDSQSQCVPSANISTTGKGLSTSNSPSLRSAFYDVLNRYSYVESVKFEITVAGNPIIFNSFTDEEQESLYERKIRYDVVPAFIFVNVNYPINSNFYEFNKSDQNSLGKFWFQGLIRIIKVTSVFEGNNFYHKISGVPMTTTNQAAQASIKEQELRKAKRDSSISEQRNSTDVTLKGPSSAGKTRNKSGDAVTIFGLNYAAIEKKSPVSFKCPPGTPLAGTLTINSSYRVTRPGNRLHAGLDLAGAGGQAIFAVCDGTIQYAGRYLIIVKPDGLIFKYYHIVPDPAYKSSTPVPITKGTKIGVLQTQAQIDKDYGKGTPIKPHLHFETAYFGVLYNPQQFIDNPKFKPNQSDVWYNTEFK